MSNFECEKLVIFQIIFVRIDHCALRVFFETSQVVLEGLQFPSGKYANGLVYFVENPWEFKMKRLYDRKKSQ